MMIFHIFFICPFVVDKFSTVFLELEIEFDLM